MGRKPIFSHQDRDKRHSLLIYQHATSVMNIHKKYLQNWGCLSRNTFKDSQKIKIEEETKTPMITDEGWNSQKQLSDPVEKKMKEKKRRKKRLLYLHPELSPGLVPL